MTAMWGPGLEAEVEYRQSELFGLARRWRRRTPPPRDDGQVVVGAFPRFLDRPADDATARAA
jgi:hypothetical protein